MTNGAEVTVKAEVPDPVPPGVVTEIVPEEAPTGTVAVIEVSERTENAAPIPLNPTAVAPVNLVPANVTVAPMMPEAGLKEVTVGADVTVKETGLLEIPPGVVTVTNPEGAPAGTIAVMDKSDATVKVAGVPLNFT